MSQPITSACWMIHWKEPHLFRPNQCSRESPDPSNSWLQGYPVADRWQATWWTNLENLKVGYQKRFASYLNLHLSGISDIHLSKVFLVMIIWDPLDSCRSRPKRETGITECHRKKCIFHTLYRSWPMKSHEHGGCNSGKKKWHGTCWTDLWSSSWKIHSNIGTKNPGYLQAKMWVF